jgi:hypothetical protein
MTEHVRVIVHEPLLGVMHELFWRLIYVTFKLCAVFLEILKSAM